MRLTCSPVLVYLERVAESDRDNRSVQVEHSGLHGGGRGCMFVMTGSFTIICLFLLQPESVPSSSVCPVSFCLLLRCYCPSRPTRESRSMNLKDWLLWIVKWSSNLYKRRVACIHTSLFSLVSCPEHQIINVLSCPLAYHPDAEYPLSWNYTFHLHGKVWRKFLSSEGAHVGSVWMSMYLQFFVSVQTPYYDKLDWTGNVW